MSRSAGEVPTIGLLGCGAVSELYYGPSLRAIEAKGLAKVAGLFDMNPERLSLMGRQLSGARQFSSLDAFLDAGLAMVIVASPARFHAEHSIAALRRGSFVLCEKPMATSVEEAESMLDAASGRLAVGLFRRFFPAARMIRECLSAGMLGKAVSFEFAEGGLFEWPAQSASFFQRKTAQGGVLLDLGVHMLDLALWWFGEPDSVEYEDDAMGGLEINSVARLGYANGLRGIARLSRDWPTSNRYLIKCEKGWLAWVVGQADQVEMGLYGDDALGMRARIHQAKHASLDMPAAGYKESFVLQILNCLEAAGGRGKLAVPAEEGLRSLRLIQRCYRSRALLKMPWLSEVEERRATNIIGG